VEVLGTQTQALKAEQAQPAPETVAAKPAASSSTPPIPESHPAPVTYESPPSYAAPVRSAPVPPTRPASQSDPTHQWQAAAALGSYGKVAYDGAKAPAPTPDASKEDAASAVNPLSQVAAPDPIRDRADTEAILSGVPHPVVSILAGAQAAATLTTPIVWAQDLDSSQQPQRFGLQLTEPILAADGSVAFPAGTQLVTQVDTLSGSGLVELSVTAVVIPTASGHQVVSVPAGAVLIQGAAGKPLMASNYTPNGDQIQRLDAGIALMGALGQVGEILNRPTSTTSTGSVFYSASTTTNPPPNILGAALQGGFDALHDQVSDRQKQQIKAILSRPDVWYVPAGVPVQVFVGQSFEVPQ
jgi:hypothetical protein